MNLYTLSWLTPITFYDGSAYCQFLDQIYTIPYNEPPQLLCTIPGLEIQGCEDASFHVACRSSQLLVISDHLYTFKPEQREFKRRELLLNMDEYIPGCSSQIFEFCGIVVLLDGRNGRIYELCDDFSLREVTMHPATEILFFGSGLLFFKANCLFDGDETHEEGYVLNLLTMEERYVAAPHIRYWSPLRVSLLYEIGETGYALKHKVVSDVFQGEPEPYLECLQKTYQSYTSQHVGNEPHSAKSTRNCSSARSDRSGCFTELQ